MNLSKVLFLALLAVVPLSCKGGGGGGSDSGKSSMPATGIRSERVQLDGPESLSGEIIRGEWNNKKLWVEIVFQNNGSSTVNFRLDQVTVDLGGTQLPAKPFLGASMEQSIDLLPSQVKTKKYGFHYLDFGVAGPTPGTYELTVRGITDAARNPIGKDLVVPFTVR
jgi:hypothetical protein